MRKNSGHLKLIALLQSCFQVYFHYLKFAFSDVKDPMWFKIGFVEDIFLLEIWKHISTAFHLLFEFKNLTITGKEDRLTFETNDLK